MKYRYLSTLLVGFLCTLFLSSCLTTRQYTNDLDMTFKLVGLAPMTFTVGSDSIYEEPGHQDREFPRHQVRLTRNYYIQITEVTQRQWEQVMENNPSFHTECGGDCPVENITWYEAVDFCNRLSEREGLTPAYSITGDEVIWDLSANGYRLPTEAEWEHAAIRNLNDRITVDPSSCDIDPYLDRVAWYCGNAGGTTHPVASKDDTGFGGVMYDTLGNVWEWCWDEFEYSYVVDDPDTPIIDPIGPSGTVSRGSLQKVIRGGSAYEQVRNCRPAKRHDQDPARRALTGLRPARFE
jgi:formylglycine-generating enzyme required for sulfatase activity